MRTLTRHNRLWTKRGQEASPKNGGYVTALVDVRASLLEHNLAGFHVAECGTERLKPSKKKGGHPLYLSPHLMLKTRNMDT